MSLTKTDLKLIGGLIDRKVGSTEKRLDSKIGGVEARINSKITGVEERLYSKIDNLETKLSGRIDGLEKRVINFELKLDTEIDALKESIAGLATRDDILQFKDDIITEFKHNRMEMAALDIRLGRVEEKVF